MNVDRQSLLDFYERHKYRRDFDREAESYHEVLRLTAFLDDVYRDVSFAQRIWHLKNDDFNIQLCPVCSTPIGWDARHRRYARFCSSQCWYIQVKTEDEQQKRRQKTLERFGVEEYGLSEEYRTKMKASTEIRRQKQNERFYRMSLDRYAGIDDVEYVGYKGTQQNPRLYVHTFKCKKCNNEFDIWNSKTYRVERGLPLCPICNVKHGTTSLAEKQLVDFIRSVYDGRIEENTKAVIPPQELDVYLPDLNLAVEYNGLWFHSSLFLPDNYHRDKTEECQRQGVRLIHVFEDDWMYRRAIMEDILRTVINPHHRQRVYARRCSIETLGLQQTNDFLERNHLQGGVLTQTVAYGLMFDGTLVALVSFVRYRDGYVLQRYSVRLGFTVLGAFSRLLCHFIRQHSPQKITTYCDKSVFTGDIYRRADFQHIRTNRPQFTFLDVQHHRRLPKQILRRRGTGYRRQQDPMPRVYGCGLDVWELNL